MISPSEKEKREGKKRRKKEKENKEAKKKRKEWKINKLMVVKECAKTKQ